ncbi:MAG TPA: von Willebrand factor type A domain-containing protein [Patescibacteria group bacterium]|nr:von Willebrand factor type A domain-containing protein [Patescibacteria group bacterium]
MKRLSVIVLILCFLSTAVAAPAIMAEQVKQTEIKVAVSANNLPLQDLLNVLSERTGIRILAVPDVAGKKVDLQIKAGDTLEQVLTLLSRTYQLSYRMNEQEKAIVVFPGSYYNESYPAAAPALFLKADALGQGNAKMNNRMMVAGMPAPYPSRGNWNTEEYKHKQDNQYQEVAHTPVSTFSIDVDTASYSNVRRFINSGQLPPADAVRTEELINYFTYDYPQPKDNQPIAVTTELGECPWQPGHQLVLLGIQGKNIPMEALPPGNLVFLIDVSGSMNEPNKLPLLKTAFKMMVKQMRDIDTVSIVVYAGQAGVVLEPTSGADKEKIIQAIDDLRAGGSTAGGEGIQLAYRLAKEHFRRDGNNRVILATDGDFNVGVSSEGEMVRMIEEKRQDGIFLSVLGFGTGNIKDNKMEALADKGNGIYAYIDNAQEAKRVVVGQLAGTLYTIAKDVKVQVEFNPAKVKYYRLLGYENRLLDKQDFNDDQKDAGDMGAGHSVTALYEVIPAGSAEVAGTVDSLIYQRSEPVSSSDLMQVKVRYKQPADQSSQLMTRRVEAAVHAGERSEQFRFAAAVAEYGLLLTKSEFKGQASYRQVQDLAAGAKGADPEGYRSEFMRLVEISPLLDGK